MGTKNNPGRFDCYKEAEPDEPMFVLLGRDKYAPLLVWMWSCLRKMNKEDLDKVEEARDCSLAMGEYLFKTKGIESAPITALVAALDFHDREAITRVVHELVESSLEKWSK